MMVLMLLFGGFYVRTLPVNVALLMVGMGPQTMPDPPRPFWTRVDNCGPIPNTALVCTGQQMVMMVLMLLFGGFYVRNLLHSSPA